MTVAYIECWGGGGGGGSATPTGTTSEGTGGTSVGGTTSTGCPAGVICVDSLPFVDDDTTSGAPSMVDAYACAPPTDESGPEVVYQVTLEEEGLLVGSLSGLPAGVDVDVHLLQALDPDTCLDRGHWDAAALLEPGTYYVVVDSWVDASGQSMEGDYTLTLALDGYADHVSDGLSEDAWSTALTGFANAWADGESDRLEYGVIDFSLPSTDHRFFVVDLRTGDLLFDLLASHGSGSQDPTDDRYADHFSNVSGSYASSLGMLRAAETFDGDHGYSLRLDGLESGWNDNVRDRAIIVHNADYATQAFVDDYGYLGRSQGCPAVDPAFSADLIDTLRDGALILGYYPDPDWLSASPYL
ncbi:MAG: murein L,D-transpeptidase catalytic domain family protein [Hyphomicrobium sp.]